MQQWEYEVDLITIDDGPPPYLDPFAGGPSDMLARALNSRGNSGWELVCILPADETHVRVVFKRPTWGWISNLKATRNGRASHSIERSVTLLN